MEIFWWNTNVYFNFRDGHDSYFVILCLQDVRILELVSILQIREQNFVIRMYWLTVSLSFIECLNRTGHQIIKQQLLC